MKHAILITILAVMLLIATIGCNEEQCTPTAWLMGGTSYDNQDNEIVGRAGVRGEGGGELGIESDWVGVHGANQSYGVYAIQELDPGPLGVPYIGGHASIIDDEDGGLYGPVVGTIVDIGGIESVVEYQYLEFNGAMEDALADWNDQHRVVAGFRIRF